jgi:hypothetical protein
VGGEEWVLREDLRDASGGKGVFGGYVEGRASEAVGRWELGAEEQRQEELGLSCAAGEIGI